MRQKATRSEASGAIVEYMGAIAGAWPRHAEQSTFTPLMEAVYCKSSIKRLRGWACRHLIGPPCMSKKIVPPEDIHAARPDY